MEEESLRKNEKRIKFATIEKREEQRFQNTIKANGSKLQLFANALREMEEAGAAPILPDGKVGGNGGFIYWDEEKKETRLFVSQSGKTAGETLQTTQFCIVENFNKEEWSAEYLSANSQSKPTSDTPLLWVSLMEAWKTYNWPKQPKVALHGHALADTSQISLVSSFDFPISEKETLFSTREDLEELESLFKRYSYPTHQIFIRRGHGFFLLAEEIDEALFLFRSRILPHILFSPSD